jgi:hypothetical protein
MTDNLSPEEVSRIEEIIYGFFLKQFGSENMAQEMMQKLANLLQDPGVKLVHFGNTVFLVIFVKPRMAEVHTMSLDEDSNTLAKHFVSLANFLKNIGVLEAYTYTDDPRFAVVAKRTRLPIQTENFTSQDGKNYTIYSVRFE